MTVTFAISDHVLNVDDGVLVVVWYQFYICRSWVYKMNMASVLQRDFSQHFFRSFLNGDVIDFFNCILSEFLIDEIIDIKVDDKNLFSQIAWFHCKQCVLLSYLLLQLSLPIHICLVFLFAMLI